MLDTLEKTELLTGLDRSLTCTAPVRTSFEASWALGNGISGRRP
jgi:hypothetical protein